jgi:release factor glutamine methyltransferase
MSAHPGRILDIGTGSGCLALTLQRLFPSAEVWGVDISPKALAVARQNGDLLARPVHWVRADVADRNFLSESPSFDLIVANPPYIPDQERSTLEPELCYEPPEALFCGTDPLRYYRLIEKHLPRLLSPGGMLAVEVHAYYGEAVRNLFCEAGWEAKLEQDYAGQPRVVWFRRPER